MTTAVEHRFGPYGGQYVPETLMPALAELEAAWIVAARRRRLPRASSRALLRDFGGRPTPLYLAERLSRGRRPADLAQARGPQAHRRAQDQQRARPGLLAKRMGKPRIIAETGAGQHGVATATVCALLGLECVVYMGAEDMRRQAPNVAADESCSARRSRRSRRARGR